MVSFMTTSELVVYIWTFSIIPVEVRQIYHGCPSTTMGKVKNYLQNQYNRFDVYSMVFIFVSLGCRLSSGLFVMVDNTESAVNKLPKSEEAIFRVFFALGFAGMCIRLLQAMQVNSKLGPKVLMVYSMVMDLVFFLGLLGMALLCYGVSTQSLIRPTKSDLTPGMVHNLFWRPYVNMFGELSLENLEADISSGYCHLARSYGESVSCDSSTHDSHANSNTTSYDCYGDPYCFYNR